MSSSDLESHPGFDSHNASYVELLFEQYLENADSVPEEWQQYFSETAQRESKQDGFSQGNGSHLIGRSRPSFRPASLFNPASSARSSAKLTQSAAMFQHRVDQLVQAFRCRGHLSAMLDPLGLAARDDSALALEVYGLSTSDFGKDVFVSVDGEEARTEKLGELVARLRETYCSHIGYEYMHIDDPVMRGWLQRRIEDSERETKLSRETQLRILTRLSDAVIFEEFVRRKYVGVKTFSLEGAETLIPLLDLAIESAAERGIRDIVIGMAHRGRLNVLANIVGKKPLQIFREFEDHHPEWWSGRGDVKYHLGASGDWEAANGDQVHLSLCFNPSHLEFVNPVALGRTRAKQDRNKDYDRQRGMTLLIHGDAAFIGEGVVQETLNLSNLEGYRTGGTLHVVVNNQLGFTTGPDEGRSTTYATDVAKMLQVPILHVNGEYPHSIAQTIRLASDFHSKFHRDVIIDIYCYRRWGHSEADEPSFTQPLIYQAIEHRDSVYTSYLEHLLELGSVTRQEAEAIAEEHREILGQQFEEAQEKPPQPEHPPMASVWESYEGGDEPADDTDTHISREMVGQIFDRLTTLPNDFHLNKKLRRGMERRKQMATGEELLDWSAAEALALGSVAIEGHPVRLAGQDSARATFSQRHAVLHDVIDGHRYEIFQHLSEDQARVEVVNSPLSEAGVLGFEYGYSLDFPEALVIWEAQFGDFANAGQVIIDQFISSAEDKWRRLSGIVLLLPHGFEGQGPEHSSARLERFMVLAAENNIQVVNPTTPAQYFHCLRRQVKRKWRKPLVVMTPKSLLRHPQVVSSVDEVTSGHFQRVLKDSREDPSATRAVMLCSGKVYYDLLNAREERGHEEIAILRVEQLYPLSNKVLRKALADYPEDVPVCWVQEEPLNMGAWFYWKRRFGDRFLKTHPFSGVARPPSASPATGSSAAHKHEQRILVEKAFGSLS